MLTGPEAIRKGRESIGDMPIVSPSMTVAELAHGIPLADTPERSRLRRQFPDESKAHIPVHPVTETTGEIIGRIGAEWAAKGSNPPTADLIL